MMIGDMIAKARKEKGMSKTELARLTDINIGHLTHIEKGERITKDKKEPLNLPKSNVVKLYLEDGSVVTVRPSGTEPKVKFYVGTVSKEKPLDDSFPKALYQSIKETLKL